MQHDRPMHNHGQQSPFMAADFALMSCMSWYQPQFGIAEDTTILVARNSVYTHDTYVRPGDAYIWQWRHMSVMTIGLIAKVYGANMGPTWDR